MIFRNFKKLLPHIDVDNMRDNDEIYFEHNGLIVLTGPMTEKIKEAERKALMPHDEKEQLGDLKFDCYDSEGDPISVIDDPMAPATGMINGMLAGAIILLILGAIAWSIWG